MRNTIFAAALALAFAFGVGPVDRSMLEGKENACPGLANAAAASKGRVLNGAMNANANSAVAQCLIAEEAV